LEAAVTLIVSETKGKRFEGKKEPSSGRQSGQLKVAKFPFVTSLQMKLEILKT
jgi:hypothetical protein